MDFAIYVKLQGQGMSRIQPIIKAVCQAKTLVDAAQFYAKNKGLGTLTQISRNEYAAGGCSIHVRKASKYEYDNFRVIRGPHTMENLDTPEIRLPIVTEGLPQTIAQWVKSMGLEWVAKAEYLFGGYYRDKDGNCYYPSSL